MSSLFPIRKLHTSKPLHRCVQCDAPVTPGLCYSGSVITGVDFSASTSHTLNPQLNLQTPENEVYIVTQKRHSFFKRTKGLLCDSCASSYATIQDSQGHKHEIVKVDPRPGFIGVLSIPLIEVIKEDPPLHRR